MQVMPVILVAAVLAVSGGLTPLGAAWNVPAWLPWLVAWLPPMAIVGGCRLLVRLADRSLRRGGGPRTILAAERAIRAARWGLVANHLLAIFVFDGLGAVRGAVGDPILLDELIAVLPPILGWAGLCWANEPIERRIHDSLMIRRLDEGRPVYESLGQAAYVWQQVRLHLLMMLAPTLAIAALSEAARKAADRWLTDGAASTIGGVSSIAVAAGVFVFAPRFAQWLLDLRPMPEGPLRRRLLDVCHAHRVKIRELMLWNTNGTMINAVVMGLFGRFRYVVITDHLLESMNEEEVVAVMAHEIGHVRRRHIPWLVVCLMASFAGAGWALEAVVFALGHWMRVPPIDERTSGILVTLATAALGLFVFGWVCRRFERQADTFAVQHLSGMFDSKDAADQVRLEAVNIMRGALGAIAEINMTDPEQPSWRHGSIAWRRRYLRSIVGRPLRDLAIDRVVKRLKWAAALLVIASLAIETALGAPEPPATAPACGQPTPALDNATRPAKMSRPAAAAAADPENPGTPVASGTPAP